MTWNETVTSFLGLHVSCNDTHTQWRLSAAHKFRQLLQSLDLHFPHKDVRAPWKSEFATLHKSQDVPLTPRQMKIRKKFRMVAGTLIYVSITVRPDITTVLNRSCQGMAKPFLASPQELLHQKELSRLILNLLHRYRVFTRL